MIFSGVVNLELPEKLFICSDVLGELWSSRKFLGAFSSHPEMLAPLMGPVERTRTRSSLAFIRKFKGTFCLYTDSFGRPSFTKNRNILVLNNRSENRS